MKPSCYCNMPQIVSDIVQGEIICSRCGVIIESRMIESVTNTLDTRPDDIRILGDGGLGGEPITKIGNKNISSIVKGMQSTDDARLVRLYKPLDAILGQMNIPKTISTDVKILARRAVDEKISRGKSVNQIVVACIMIACKKHGRIIDDQEIIQLANISKKSAYRTYRSLIQRWNIKPHDTQNEIRVRINKACKDLNIQYMTQAVLNIFENCPSEIISHPGVCTSGCIYIACQGKISQNTISTVTGVSSVSLRKFTKRYEQIKDLHNVSNDTLDDITSNISENTMNCTSSGTTSSSGTSDNSNNDNGTSRCTDNSTYNSTSSTTEQSIQQY